MVGIGGYARGYLLALEKQSTGQLAAIVDPMAESALAWPCIQEQKTPVFDSIKAFLDSGIQIDLAVISSPISFHAEQSCALLEVGINVLCEKPIAATVAEANRMRAARDASGKFLEIGYQWCFSQAIQALKIDIMKGDLGKAETLRTRVEWPRSSSYYARNSWAGCIRNEQGRVVNDSPVGNATAHYLFNMLYLLGKEPHLAARPKRITAECYRANPIQNYDTACCHIETEEGTEIYFYTTHAVKEPDGPVFKYQFEKAEVRYESGGEIIAYLKDGTVRNYGDPNSNSMLKLEFCIQKCLAPNNSPSICSAEAASMHTACVEALQKTPIKTIPENQFERIRDPKDNALLIYIPGLDQAIKEAFDRKLQFSDLSLPWTMPAPMTIDM